MELNLLLGLFFFIDVDPYLIDPPLLEGFFIDVGLLGNFLLNIAHLDSVRHPSHLLNLFHLLGYPPLHLVRKGFNIIRPS